MTDTSSARHTEEPDARNMRLVGHCDMGGLGDGMHINIKDGYAFFGHMGEAGTSIVDVRDPERPVVVGRLPAPPNTHSHKVQIVDDLLVVNRERLPDALGGTSARPWTAGLALFDVSDPTAPREIGSWSAQGKGVHRMTYWEPPYAYLGCTADGFEPDRQILIVLDLTDPSQPVEVGRWWYPGMHLAAGEARTWPQDRRARLHHGLPRGERLYCGWGDLGLVILDVADPTTPGLVSHTPFPVAESRRTHTACPVPGRDLLIVVDESIVEDCSDGRTYHVRVVDIADDAHPRVVSTFPIPPGDFCARGGRFGPHNVHEPRPGSCQDPDTVFLTYFNAGVRAVDVSDPAAPVESGHFVPPAPTGQRAIQINDIFVDADGLVYASDRLSGGLYILERTGA